MRQHRLRARAEGRDGKTTGVSRGGRNSMTHWDTVAIVVAIAGVGYIIEQHLSAILGVLEQIRDSHDKDEFD
jgi:hypothetical protein